LDWIERIFHVSPDGGNGLTEGLVGALGAALVGGAVFLRWIRRVRTQRLNRDPKAGRSLR
jgi:hypothetical protein